MRNGLGVQRWRAAIILMSLVAHGPQSIRALGERLDADHTTLWQAIYKLPDLVERDADGRLYALVTPAEFSHG